MKDYVILSFSGGKDSSAMLLEWLERHNNLPNKYPLDEVVYIDVGKEFPSMIEHVNKIENIVLCSGVKFTRLRSNYSFDYYMFDYEAKRRNSYLKDFRGYSWPGPRSRWCTSKLKVEVIGQYLKELNKKYRVIQLIGIAADEKYRLTRPCNQQPNHFHPLYVWGWTEADCLQYCYNRGFDWGGLYEIFGRVSCWCCPLQSLDELRKLRKYFPVLWDTLLDMERRTWRNFRADYSVDDLEIRFALEDEWRLKGLPVNMNKNFRAELNRRLNRNEVK